MNQSTFTVKRINETRIIRDIVLAFVIAIFTISVSLVSVYGTTATIKTSGVSYPTALESGSSFTVKGTVTSSVKMTTATVNVLNSSKSSVMSKKVTVNAKTFKLSTVDSYLSFGKLDTGNYTYRCKVVAGGKTYTAFSKTFVVYKLSSSDVGYPTVHLVKGQSYSFTGIVNSDNVAIDQLKVGITDSKGNWLADHYQEVKVNATSTDISKLSNNKFGVSKLDGGTYYYRAEAVLGGNSIKVFNKSFTIDENATVTKTSLSLPTTLKPGASFTVKGTLTANAKISKIKLGIVNTKGKWLYTSNKTVNSTSYDLSALDSAMKFSQLSAGQYYYRCILTILGKEYTVFNKNFAVCTISKSNVKYPTILLKGNAYSLTGTVKSTPNMSKITVGIMKDGAWLKDHYVTVNKSQASYNLASADSKISFKDLEASDDYKYVCKVTVLGVEKTVFSYNFEVVKDVAITLSNVAYPPDQLGVGKSFSISGKISSTSKMTKIRVGIVDTDGKWQVYKDFSPNAKTWNISNADSYITFGTVPTGTYYYRIIVYVGSKSYTKVNKKYKVVSSGTKITKSTVTTRINELISALDGKYFTTTGGKASSSVDSKCNVDNVLAKNQTVRNMIKKNKGDGYEPTSLSLLPLHYGHDYGSLITRGYSCAGFANFAEWYIFANSCSDDVSTVTIKKGIAANYANASAYLKPGDVIRVTGIYSSGHSAIVISVKNTGIEVIDCNTSQYSLLDVHASRVCHYTLSYLVISKMSISRSTASPYI